MKSFPPLLFMALLFAITSCEPEKKENIERAPVIKDLGAHQLKITTQSDSAQLFFNQGLILSYGFNHAEAARSFRYAAYLDPQCAMCRWGVALVLGPNMNAPMDTAAVAEAYAASREAQELAPQAADWKQALIAALTQRYVNDKSANRAPLDSAYAAAMRDVYQRFPDNPDIGSLFAESLLDVHPWDYWHRNGVAKPWTAEIMHTLEQVLHTDSLHPGANHFYIHVTEASQTPELALPSADRLMWLVPAGGHLVHMAAHTYLRTGDYHKGTLSNQRATEADSLYITACHAQGVYPLTYVPHNHHFLAATASLEGDSKTAIASCFQTMKHIKPEDIRIPGLNMLQQFHAVPYNVLVKFGRWDDILSLPAPHDEFPYPVAIWHYAKGMAHAGKNQLAAAEQELEFVKNAENDSALKEVVFWSYNSAATTSTIARSVLEARIAEEKGEFDKAVGLLQNAIALEDSLIYTEPPDWFFSVRHELGATLMRSKKYADAEKVYRDDLTVYRENGWALNGLVAALEAQKKAQEAEAAKARFAKAWQYADVKLNNSRVATESGKETALNSN